MPWEPPEVETDIDAATVRILDGMAARMPGWVPVEGAPEVALAQELGRESAELARLAGDTLSTAIAGIGETVFGVVPNAAASATVVTFMIADVGPYGGVIPAGFTVIGRNPAGEEVAFATTEEYVQDSPVVVLTLRATEAGTRANGVAADSKLQIVTASNVITRVTAYEASVGGVDAEQLDAYLARLKDYLAILHPAGVLGDDMATLLRTTMPGVARAVAIDGYDAFNGTSNNERTMTIWAVNELGAQVPPAGVLTHLEQYREANLRIRGGIITYSPLTIQFAGLAGPGADPDLVQTNLIGALSSYISPATWGATEGEPTSWVNTKRVPYLDLVRLAATVPGLRSLTSLTVNGAAADVDLEGAVPLPSPTYGPDPSVVFGTIA